MRNGMKHGKGILLYKNGDQYDGEFRNDKFNGQGTYKYNSNH